MLRGLILAVVLAVSLPALAQESATPWIGIALSAGTEGVRIARVMEQTPAQRAGLVAGDEVLALDDTPVKTGSDLISRVADKGIGETVTLRVLRGGKRLDIKLALEARPDQLDLMRSQLVGKKAPAFALEAVAGGPAKLAELGGHVVVLEFWATWCGPCNSTMPRLSQWQERYGARGLKVIGVSTESLEVVRKHIAKRPVAYTLVHDEGAISAAYVVPAVPTFVVIDDKGIVRHVDVGAGTRVDAVEAAFLPLLARAK